MTTRLGITTLSMFALIVGCSGPSNEDDPIDAVVVTDGKADAFGIEEGTPSAAAILRVANELSLDDLKDRVGVTSRAASGIVSDRPFSTLTALDAVPYVGPVTFSKLSSYAQANGYVSELPSCDGVGRLPTVGSLPLTGGTRMKFTRTCDPWGTCTAWADAGTRQPVTAYDSSAFRIDPQGDAWIESNIGPASSGDGYTCQEYDYIIGYAKLDPTSGDGTEHVYGGTACNANGGDGGPGDVFEPRDVKLHYGSSCLSAIDAEPPPVGGTQTLLVTVFTWE
jgi:hypothetical protein